MDLKPFLDLSSLFAQHGFRLWTVGGTTRDYVLHLPIEDMDLTTDALPSQMQTFLSEANYRFAHYGTVMVSRDGIKIDITTLRQESAYLDKRHPQSITFVTDPKLDYPRRDLTINALYMNANQAILDFAGGLEDLKSKTLRMIGDPFVRIQEDPLRILRVLRFHHRFGFQLEARLAQALGQSIHLLDLLNPQKVTEEIRKMMMDRPHEASILLASYGIHPHQE